MPAIPMTPVGLPDPGLPPMVTKTLERWTQFLGSIAAGVHLAEAMKKHYITRADIEACTRHDPAEFKRWNEARAAGRRRAWSVLDLEEIFVRVAAGASFEDACVAVKGSFSSEVYAIINSDAGLRDMYKEAQEAKMLLTMERVLDYADDDSGDTIEGPKGTIPNMAAVGRSKLQVDSRFRLANLLNRRIFGEKTGAEVNVTIHNHAERLEEARTQLARARRGQPLISPQQMREAVEATFSEAPAADLDTSWMDEKPTETMWREES